MVAEMGNLSLDAWQFSLGLDPFGLLDCRSNACGWLPSGHIFLLSTCGSGRVSWAAVVMRLSLLGESTDAVCILMIHS